MLNLGQPFAFEYTQAATPDLKLIQPEKLLSAPMSKLSHLVYHDFKEFYNTPYRATTPNCLTAFAYVYPQDPLTISSTAGSHVLVVVSGAGFILADGQRIALAQHDALTLPNAAEITIEAVTSLKIYLVSDEPLFNRLGATPQHATFRATKYSYQEFIAPEIEHYNQQENAHLRNRNGIILANEACLDSKTITPTLWGLYNIIYPNSVQLPHRHNSVALDLCLSAAADGVYTLMSESIDAQGKLMNPTRMDWQAGHAFTTPPGWWHSHHNESAVSAVVFPLQDAGLHTYLRTLDIQFVRG